ncbi:MAG: hypothetical protein R3B48_09715 [Kofleriaceae bacterium]
MTRDAGVTGAPCAHLERVDGLCPTCGDCTHEVILNLACLACGSTDLDPVAVSPKPVAFVPAARLRRP